MLLKWQISKTEVFAFRKRLTNSNYLDCQVLLHDFVVVSSNQGNLLLIRCIRQKFAFIFEIFQEACSYHIEQYIDKCPFQNVGF